MKRCCWLFLVILLSSGSLLAEQLPSRTRGLSADSIFQIGDIDNINLFNGNLSIAIPIGQNYPVSPQLSYRLTLVYNSSVWDYEDELSCLVNNERQYFNFPFPVPTNNAGMGWSLHFGRLAPPNDPVYNKKNPSWLFVAPDGSQHNFYGKLHPTEPMVADTYYSLDGAYMRLKVIPNTSATVETPDGLVRSFVLSGGVFLLTEIADRFGNWVHVTYSATSWEITDSHGRSHTLTLDAKGNVKTVAVEAFGGAPAIYSFTYTLASVERHRFNRLPCDMDSDHTENVNNAPLLTLLEQPAGTSYSFTYDSSDATSTSFSGAIRQMVLPTRGRVEWDYDTYSFQSQAATVQDTTITQQRGIGARRTYLNAATTEVQGSWTYDYTIGLEGPPGPFHIACWHRMQVSDNISNQVTDSFFATAYGSDMWWYGLPYAPCNPDDVNSSPVPWSASNGQPYLSTRVSQRNPSNGELTTIRETYVIYDSDGRDAGAHQDRNHRLRYQKVVYYDDTDGLGLLHTEETINSDFDGLGHYRSTTRKSSFGPEKVVSTSYLPSGSYQLNPDTSSVITDTFTVPSPSSPWLSGLSSGSTTTQGASVSKRETCFDSSTGFLLRQRLLAGSAQQGKDVVATFEPGDDADGHGGFVVAERLYGGDTSNNIPSGNLCDLTLDSPVSVKKSSYKFGAMTRGVWVEPCDEDTEVLVAEEAEIDQNTGLPQRVIESNGLATVLEYDIMGRFLAEVPDEGASRTHKYDFSKLSYEVRHCPQGVDTFCNSDVRLSDRYWAYDGLGRVARKAMTYPGAGGDAEPSVSYTLDGIGRKIAESTWGGAHHTTFDNFDVFGRARTIAPQGVDATLLTFNGERLKTREVQVATSEGGTQSVFTTEAHDHLGRLVAVCDGAAGLWDGNSNGGCPGQLTRYTYDQDDRLVKVCQKVASNGVCGQQRTFSWDGRGFLISETHPEIGASGNGTIVYQRDARGNPTYRDIQNDTGDRPLAFTYDPAGRAIRVEELASTGWRTLKEFFYARSNVAGSSEKRRGQLIMARRTNWVTLLSPLPPLIEGSVPLVVTDHYEYFGLGGRVSKKTTSVTLPSGNQSWSSNFSYDLLGNIASITYPAGDWPYQSAPARQVSYSHRLGFLTAIPGYATQIDYQLGGMARQIEYENGLFWNQIPEAATGWERPDRIETVNGANQVLWTTDDYAYDGAGNISAIGDRTYVYDAFSRLRYAKRSGQPQREQEATFDDYGNLIALAKNGVVRTLTANANTNRLATAGTLYTSNGELSEALIDGTKFAYDYDGLGQQLFQRTTSKTWVYAYDANDERILSWQCPGLTCASERYTLRGLGGEVLRVFEGPARAQLAWKEDFVYRDGQPLAWIKTDPAGEKRLYLHADHLGSTRLVTDTAGNQVDRHDFLPFGEESTATASGDIALKFTGHERDQPGKPMDYMHARSCSPVLGRFLRVDPSGSSARLPSPQTWNRYIYVRNNPLAYVDPNGEAAIFFVVSPGSHDIKSSFGHAAYLATSKGNRASVSRGTSVQLTPSISGFINEYLSQGRTVTAFVLRSDPERDAILVQRANELFPAFNARRQNCTTACADALRAAGAMDTTEHPEAGLIYDSPENLQKAFASGVLKTQVKETVIFDPGSVQEVTQEQVKKYLDVSDIKDPGSDQ